MDITPENLSIINATIKLEGGYVNDPDDAGGPTNMGITQKTYDEWCETTGELKFDVKSIEEPRVIEVYHDMFMQWPKIAQIPDIGIRRLVFDCAVLHGPSTGIKMIQHGAGAHADGIIGPNTLQHISLRTRKSLILLTTLGRLEYIKTLNQAKFNSGWILRALQVMTAAENLEDAHDQRQPDRIRPNPHILMRPSQIASAWLVKRSDDCPDRVRVSEKSGITHDICVVDPQQGERLIDEIDQCIVGQQDAVRNFDWV